MDMQNQSGLSYAPDEDICLSFIEPQGSMPERRYDSRPSGYRKVRPHIVGRN